MKRHGPIAHVDRVAAALLVLLLCGDTDAWDADELGKIRERYRDLLGGGLGAVESYLSKWFAWRD